MRNSYLILPALIFSACSDTELDKSKSISGGSNYEMEESHQRISEDVPASAPTYAWESDYRGSESYDYDQYGDEMDYATSGGNSSRGVVTYALDVSDNIGIANVLEPNKFKGSGSTTTTIPQPKGDQGPNNTTSNPKPTDVPAHKALKIIKDGNMTVRSKNIDSSKFNIDKLIHQWEGYYQTEKLEHYEQRSVYNLVIRVPSEHYEKVLSGIERGGDSIEFKNITASDVTEEYNDVFTQLQNKKAYLNRYLQLLSQAKNVKEILMIEDHIRPLQSDIERHIGRLRFLDDRVGFSTLSVMLYQEHEVVVVEVDEDSFWYRLGKSFKSGWSYVVNFILNLISIWPQLLIGIGLFLFIRSRRKRIITWFKK